MSPMKGLGKLVWIRGSTRGSSDSRAATAPTPRQPLLRQLSIDSTVSSAPTTTSPRSSLPSPSSSKYLSPSAQLSSWDLLLKFKNPTSLGRPRTSPSCSLRVSGTAAVAFRRETVEEDSPDVFENDCDSANFRITQSTTCATLTTPSPFCATVGLLHTVASYATQSAIDATLDLLSASTEILTHPTCPPPTLSIAHDVLALFDRLMRLGTALLALLAMCANQLLVLLRLPLPPPIPQSEHFFIPSWATPTLKIYPRLRRFCPPPPPIPVTDFGVRGAYAVTMAVQATRAARRAAYGLAHLLVALCILRLLSIPQILKARWMAKTYVRANATSSPSRPVPPPHLAALFTPSPPLSIPDPLHTLRSYEHYLESRARDRDLSAHHLARKTRRPFRVFKHLPLRRWVVMHVIPGADRWLYRRMQRDNYAHLGITGPLDPASSWGRVAYAVRAAPDPLDVWWEERVALAVAARRAEDAAFDAGRVEYGMLSVETDKGEVMPDSWVAPVWEF